MLIFGMCLFLGLCLFTGKYSIPRVIKVEFDHSNVVRCSFFNSDWPTALNPYFWKIHHSILNDNINGLMMTKNLLLAMIVCVIWFPNSLVYYNFQTWLNTPPSVYQMIYIYLVTRWYCRWRFSPQQYRSGSRLMQVLIDLSADSRL